MKDYIDRIKEQREDNDIKQETIAKIINTNQSNYSKIERKERNLNIEQLIKICYFYNLSSDYILGLPKGLNYPEN